jgi:hypothetical protein
MRLILNLAGFFINISKCHPDVLHVNLALV